MKRITYDKSRFKQVMLGIDIYERLMSLKDSVQQSFSDVVKKLVAIKDWREDTRYNWSITKPVKDEVKPIWESEELFD